MELHITSSLQHNAESQLAKKQRSSWVRIYVHQKRHHYGVGVYMTLLPDLAAYHMEKFRNFVRMDFENFELFTLVETAITKKTTKFR